jgi:hypothetical protein
MEESAEVSQKVKICKKHAQYEFWKILSTLSKKRQRLRLVDSVKVSFKWWTLQVVLHFWRIFKHFLRLSTSKMLKCVTLPMAYSSNADVDNT